MRFLVRAVEDACAAARAAFNPRQIIRWVGFVFVIATAATAVVLASFVAVALNLT
jgi:hypothetical protein